MSVSKELNPILICKNLSKVYDMGEIKVDALKDVSFEIYEGEFIVILGPSGSGKSTLLNLIGGMDKVEKGELYYKKESIHSLDKKGLSKYRRDTIGFVFQFYNLIPTLNAYENVALAAHIARNPLLTEEVLKHVGLEERMYHFPSQMSGGQQQRAAMARAIVKNPDILLCDEPTGALDTNTGMQIMDLLKNINKSFNKTVIVITHDTEISNIADRIFHIRDGVLSMIEKVEQHVIT